MAKPAETLSGLRPYPAYKPSGVKWLGDVPVHWQMRRLKTLCSKSAIYGANVAATSYAAAGVRFIRTTDITEDGILRPTGVFLPREAVRDYILTDGDLLISRSGTIGRSFLYRAAVHGPCAYAGYLVRFVLASGVSPEYTFLFTKTPAFGAFLQSKTVSSTIENVNASKYANCPLPVPPLAEQVAIARYLNQADRRIQRCIQAKEKLFKLLEVRRQALVNEVVTGRVDVRTGQPYSAYKPSKVEWLARMPTHWEVRRLKTIASIRYGLGQPPPESKHGLPFIRATNIDNGRIVRKDLIHVDPANVPISRNPFLDRKEIIVVRSGAYTADSAIVEERYVGAIAGYDMVVRVTGAEPEFVARALLSKYVRQDQLIVVSTRSAQPHLNAEELGSAVLLLPPRLEQSAIARYVDHADRRIRRSVESVQRQIHLLNEYRTRLIADVVTGKLDVREVASGLADDREELEVITGLDDSAVTSGESARNANDVTHASEA